MGKISSVSKKSRHTPVDKCAVQ